jgi:hypothetical protein
MRVGQKAAGVGEASQQASRAQPQASVHQASPARYHAGLRREVIGAKQFAVNRSYQRLF